MTTTEPTPEATAAVNDAVDWDDRKTLSDLWQDRAPLPDEGLSERVYEALIAVAQYGAARLYENEVER
jgi:hypothetical protein